MISIKRAQTEDAHELLKIRIEAFKEDEDLYGFGPPGYDSLENLLNAIESAVYFKILDAEKIIGGMSVYELGENVFWLGAIYLKKEYQNKGIGSCAIRFLENEFPEVRSWRLETPYLSFRNHHFYEKLGYVKSGEKVHECCNPEFFLYIYEKTIQQ